MSAQAGERKLLWRSAKLAGVEVHHAEGPAHYCHMTYKERYSIKLNIRDHARFRYRCAHHTVQDGVLQFVEPGELYVTTKQECPYIVRAVFLSVERMEEVAQGFGICGTPHFTTVVAQNNEIANALLRFHRALEHGAPFLAQHNLLLEFFRLVFERFTNEHPVERKPNPAAVEVVKDILHARWQEDVTLDDLAAAVERHPVHIAQVFKAHMGVPPHRYLLLLRLAHAQQMLAQGNPVAYVAHTCGFSDQSHLTRQFKRTYGIGPGAYARIGQP